MTAGLHAKQKNYVQEVAQQKSNTHEGCVTAGHPRGCFKFSEVAWQQGCIHIYCRLHVDLVWRLLYIRTTFVKFG